MSLRPETSAGDARPQTSSGFPPTATGGGFDYDPQYTYSIEEEEEDDESEAEDLFAFLPPSTADQEKQHQEHTDSQQATDPAKVQPDYEELFAASLPPPQELPIPPPPALDPYARYPVDSTIGPSTAHSPVSRLPVESPPSTGTGSQPHALDGAYPMHRMSHPPTHSVSTRTRTSGVSSREVHIELPAPLETSIDTGFTSPGKHRSSTIADTTSAASLTPSMLEQDSRDGSVK